MRLTKIIYLLHPQNLLLDARISDISRTLCRVIVHFVPNFVAMATGVGRGKMRLAAFSGQSPKLPPTGAKISQISLTQTELYPTLSQISLPWCSEVKLNNIIRLAIPENHTLEPKITTLSYTQPKL